MNNYITAMANVQANMTSWYDVIAFIYDYLKEQVRTNRDITEQSLVHQVVPDSTEKEMAPIYCQFQIELHHLLEDNFPCFRSSSHGVDFQALLTFYHGQLQSFSLSYPSLTLLHTVLTVVNDYFSSQKYRDQVVPLGQTSLNNKYREHCAFYPKSPLSFLDFTQVGEKKLDFKPLRQESLKRYYSGFSIWEGDTDHSFAKPKVKPIFPENYQFPPSFLSKQPSKQQDLRVVLLPFGCVKDEFLFPKVGNSSTGEVVYTPHFREKMRERILPLFQRALEEHANIIVLPELYGVKEAQEAVMTYIQDIKKKSPERLQELILLVFGTEYQKKENILSFYDRNGIRIGEYSKAYGFLDKNTNLREALEPAGRYCSIVDIHGMGRILPSICYEFVHYKRTEFLTDTFLPFMVFCPAYSRSVDDAFFSSSRNLSENYLTCVVICNACSSRWQEKVEDFHLLSYLTVPKKVKTRNHCEITEIRRETDCRETCGKNNCIILAHYQFSPTRIQTGDVLPSIIYPLLEE